MKAVTLLFLSILLVLLAASANAADAAKSPRLITVTGEAQVNVVPDEVAVSIGVQACGNTATEARLAEEEIAKKVVDVTKQLKIETRDLQTDSIEIDLVKPEYYDWRMCYENKEPKKYGARQMIRITLKDVSVLEDLLTKSLEVGATKIMGVEFKTSELRKYRDQARAMAIIAAKEKATALAGELDCKIGKPQTITEQTSYGRDWYYYGSSWWWGRSNNSGANWVQNASDAPSAVSGTAISLGQIAVTAKVSVSFDLN